MLFIKFKIGKLLLSYIYVKEVKKMIIYKLTFLVIYLNRVEITK